MNKTNIEYLDFTWNPLAMRCTPVSEGCANCWHIKMANRVAKIPGMMFNEEMSYRGINKPYLVKERLNDPLKRKKPAIIGVQFMGDLFHKDVPFHMVDRILGQIQKAPQHTFLILTKRPDTMARHFRAYVLPDWSADRLANLWLGVTAENQQTADERIPILLQIPAAKRFVSIEPMLGPVDFGHLWLGEERKIDCGGCSATPVRGQPYCPGHEGGGIDWVIAGCESGPGRRSAKIEWFRNLKNQCVKAGVPFFLKQMEGIVGVKSKKWGLMLKSIVVKMPYLDRRQWNERP